jgi:hypothetical protein
VNPSPADLSWQEFEAARQEFDARRKTAATARRKAVRAGVEPPVELAADAPPANALPQRWRPALPPPEAVVKAAAEVAAEVAAAPRLLAKSWRRFWQR